MGSIGSIVPNQVQLFSSTRADTQFRTPQSPFKFNASEWFFVSWAAIDNIFEEFMRINIT